MNHTCQGTLRQEWSWLVCTRAHSAPPPAIRSQQNSNHPKCSCIWKYNKAALDEGLFEQANVLAETRSARVSTSGDASIACLPARCRSQLLKALLRSPSLHFHSLTSHSRCCAHHSCPRRCSCLLISTGNNPVLLTCALHRPAVIKWLAVF